MRILLLDKAAGWTSHDLVSLARGALQERKIGHAGTLDPFATGLMVLGVGRATRLLEYLVGLDKEYAATLRLGIGTDTHDPEGEQTAADTHWQKLDGPEILKTVAAMKGTQLQRPPRYSAIKIGGVPAHRRTRRGEDVRLSPRTVTIHAIEVTAIALPTLEIRVRCSSGTYIRRLAADLGRSLGTVAHLTDLRRLRVGSLHADRAASIAALRACTLPATAWVKPAEALSHLDRLVLSSQSETLVAAGRPVPASGPDANPVAALTAADRLVAVGAVRGGVFRPAKVFSMPEPSHA